jgi:peptidoglycan/LPS O-acetylase OafA/YrhL
MAAVGLPAVAVAFGALVWAGAKAEGRLGRIFRASFLRRIGRISYALYLAHFPMLAIADSVPYESRTARYGLHVAATIVAYLWRSCGAFSSGNQQSQRLIRVDGGVGAGALLRRLLPIDRRR